MGGGVIHAVSASMSMLCAASCCFEPWQVLCVPVGLPLQRGPADKGVAKVAMARGRQSVAWWNCVLQQGGHTANKL